MKEGLLDTESMAVWKITIIAFSCLGVNEMFLVATEI